MFGIAKKEFTEKEIYLPSPTVDQKIVLIMVNKLFQEKTFYYSDFDAISKTFNVKWTRPDLTDRLRHLTCVKRSDMDKDIFDFVVESIKELLRTGIVQNEHKKPFFTFSDMVDEPTR